MKTYIVTYMVKDSIWIYAQSSTLVCVLVGVVVVSSTTCALSNHDSRPDVPVITKLPVQLVVVSN